jgi:hypothetical protein
MPDYFFGTAAEQVFELQRSKQAHVRILIVLFFVQTAAEQEGTRSNPGRRLYLFFCTASEGAARDGHAA